MGFHAQQAVEKALKAAIAKRNEEFPFTHDIGLLMQLCQDAGLNLPVDLSEADRLTPYAAAIRYGLRGPCPPLMLCAGLLLRSSGWDLSFARIPSRIPVASSPQSRSPSGQPAFQAEGRQFKSAGASSLAAFDAGGGDGCFEDPRVDGVVSVTNSPERAWGELDVKRGGEFDADAVPALGEGSAVGAFA